MPPANNSIPHWRLILNGKAAGDAALRAAVQDLRLKGICLSVRVTWESGDAERLMAERDPLYREIADLVINTDGRRVQTVAREIQQGRGGHL